MRAVWRNRRGAALVEFAIVAMLLLTLVFGIIEFGLIIKDYLTVNQAAREGARAAALRGDVEQVKARVAAGAAGFSEDQQEELANSVVCDRREFTEGVGWGDWTPGLPAADANVEAQVRVHVTYPHPTIIGSLFGLGEEVFLPGSMVMRRE